METSGGRRSCISVTLGSSSSDFFYIYFISQKIYFLGNVLWGCHLGEPLLHQQLSLHFHLKDFLLSNIWTWNKKRLLFAGKCVRQQFDVNAKFCCVKNPSDGSGVIVADEGMVGTPGGGTTCPGDSLEMCIEVCPSANARLYGACVRGCAKRCPSTYVDLLLNTVQDNNSSP